MRPNGAPPPVLPTLERALHIQNTAASPLLEPRLKAALGIHRSSSVARKDAQPAELQEHPSQLSLAEKRQDWRKRRREVQLSKLFHADKRQDWRKRRQKPWRLNLYSVIPSGLIPSGCSDDDDDDADDAHADDHDDHLRVACYPRASVSHVTLGRPCHMLFQGGRVTCYPGRPGVALRRRKIAQRWSTRR